jgi:DUF1680 family protein
LQQWNPARHETEKAGNPIKAVGITNVEVTEAFCFQTTRSTNITIATRSKIVRQKPYGKFPVAAEKKKEHIKVKCPSNDTDVYKIIEGASLSLISNPNPVLETYLDSIISIIAVGQEPDGYLTTWFTIDRKTPPAWWVKPSTNRWENEQSSHEHYNSGHMFEAAAALTVPQGKEIFWILP